jgi:hypothetical protein
MRKQSGFATFVPVFKFACMAVYILQRYMQKKKLRRVASHNDYQNQKA